MQINMPPNSTAMTAKAPPTASIAAANRSATGSLGAVNAEGGTSESGGGGGLTVAGRGEAGATKRGRGRLDPHLGQNVDMLI